MGNNIKIAGIIVLGVCFIGLLIWSAWMLKRHQEQEANIRRIQRAAREEDNNFILRLFKEIGEDQSTYIDQLRDVINTKDLEIAELQTKLNNLIDTASKCHIKDFNNAQEGQA